MSSSGSSNTTWELERIQSTTKIRDANYETEEYTGSRQTKQQQIMSFYYKKELTVSFAFRSVCGLILK